MYWSDQLIVQLFPQLLYGGREGQGLQAKYVVLDSDGDRLVPTHSLAPTHSGGMLGGLRPLSRSFVFPGGRPSKDNFCWFNPDEACSGGAFTDLPAGWDICLALVLERSAHRCCCRVLTGSDAGAL